MMAIVRWDPLRDVHSLRDETNRLFTRSLGEGATGGTRISARMENGVLELRVPKADGVRPRRIAVAATADGIAA